MSILRGRLNQTATLWIPGPGPPDMFGNPQWSEPQVISVRWQQHQQEVTNFEGKQIVSQALIHTEAQVIFGSRLAQGEHTDINPLEVEYPTWEPQSIADLIGLDGQNHGRKVWL